jgi:hypothetical protein
MNQVHAVLLVVALQCMAASLVVAWPGVSSRTARGIIARSGPLTAADIAAILIGSRRAITSRTFRLRTASENIGPEVLMGADGQPRLVRTTGGVIGGTVAGSVGGSPASEPPHWIDRYVVISDYTRAPARRCNGAIAPEGTVIEYVHHDHDSSGRWTVTARLRRGGEFASDPLSRAVALLRGAAYTSLDERQSIDGHLARPFSSSWEEPPPDPRSRSPVVVGDPLPNVIGEPSANEAIQSLWIDIATLLPVRWEVSKRGHRLQVADFDYATIDLRTPSQVRRPSCVP